MPDRGSVSGSLAVCGGLEMAIHEEQSQNLASTSRTGCWELAVKVESLSLTTHLEVWAIKERTADIQHNLDL